MGLRGEGMTTGSEGHLPFVLHCQHHWQVSLALQSTKSLVMPAGDVEGCASIPVTLHELWQGISEINGEKDRWHGC